ncbi:uncharacterized protein NECHADRAFT_106029 [Fusarium vanettenii 77-13-4]|uniref:alpha-1,2-Mannosidase n=1 Tax=Fusarium vanettenii (strain ATCC MYA-4622 / CBS 123669 / FGSC 9596 / NRRL 45880 / 77-13-4) TaxID=660122 RepID=C7YPC9_FUSV7|nr:uncharacterized protein NECHADRAFT_106029 [Fusarium vanettenii 77-13-4]EEU45822.1 hypothetical protein NECHADRAFT_106029 [Fusarium vanettenii 77-13-4]
MLPLRRRGRFYTIISVFLVFILYRYLQNSWAQSAEYNAIQQPPVPPPVAQPPPVIEGSKEAFEPAVVPPVLELPNSEGKDSDSIPRPAVPQGDSNLPEKVEISEDKTLPESNEAINEKVETAGETLPDPEKPAQENAQAQANAGTEGVKKPEEQTSPETPPLQVKDPPVTADNPDQPRVNVDGSKIHWTKPKENFPLPAESIIPIPTGTAPDMNRIQFDFQLEDEGTRKVRLERRQRVKAELVRAWAGYRKYAFMHDELLPLSMGFRETFGGWGATLVDSLDTLWIADMKEEFDEAANAVAKIDFTFTDRNDIPVFETTIRYLGGLIGAYDVSGGPNGKYKILLDKAVELAEILMGAFDTPNRMPLLYYRWRAPYSSQPHRASVVSIAELASLSMEFTHLAQLTGEAKYYDAVARITNALVKMQEDGTEIPGLFPEKINASGCNKTAATLKQSLSKEAQGQVEGADLTKQPQGFIPGGDKQQADAVTPAQMPQADSRWEDKLRRRDAPPALPVLNEPYKVEEQEESKPVTNQPPPLAADGTSLNWECEPQGLVPGSYAYGQFHMGGAQDSAYEYFAKQYLLLNGLEPKYRKLYEDTIDAINEWLLYRPMVKEDGWDVFFTGKMTTSKKGDSEWSKSYEMTHLTCFIGGMYGLGGKIFGRDGDIDKAKKLTDGCVWAYQSTPTGLMPEYAHLVACPALEKCPFNESTWYEDLDPSLEWRQNQLSKWKEGEEQQKLVEKAAPEVAKEPHRPDDLSTGSEPVVKAEGAPAAGEGLSKPVKRAGIPMPELDRSMEEDDSEFGSELPDSLKAKLGLNKDETEKTESSEAESDKKPAAAQEGTSTSGGQVPAVPDSFANKHAEQVAAPNNQPPEKPLSHEEFVKAKLERENLPPGYTDIINKSYILRPEAIESVWYMYRITGDTTWMDKGWKMFQATVTATRTEFANSAINDVLNNAEPGLKDEMESFWIAETLKYYLLLFSEPSLISLDEWVLNTEAHPFKRPS